MTDIDVSKIKPGDVVGVRVLDLKRAGECVRIDAGEAYGHTYIQRSAIVSHTPAPRPALKVGDRVIAGDSGTTWEIAFIEGGQYAHFAVIPKTYKRRVPAPLSEVETWERLS